MRIIYDWYFKKFGLNFLGASYYFKWNTRKQRRFGYHDNYYTKELGFWYLSFVWHNDRVLG
jgi:hypothetical protein